MADKLAPGWHADPQSPELQRWHDGDAWTEHTRAGAPHPSGNRNGGWWAQRSKGARIAIIAVGSLAALSVLGNLVGEDEPQTETASDAQDTAPEPAAAPPEPVEATPEPAEADREPVEAETTEPAEEPEPEPAEPANSGYERLVLSRDAGVNVRAINEVERSLADQLVQGLEGEAWWPLVGEVYVDEDLFISDVRVGLDVLYHADTTDLAVEVCDAFLTALPNTDSAVQILIQPASVTGGGTEIDGSATPWEVSYFDTMARGTNVSDPACTADTVRQTQADRSEAYLADQA